MRIIRYRVHLCFFLVCMQKRGYRICLWNCRVYTNLCDCWCVAVLYLSYRCVSSCLGTLDTSSNISRYSYGTKYDILLSIRNHSGIYSLHILHILRLQLYNPLGKWSLSELSNRAFESRLNMFGGCLCASTIFVFLKVFLISLLTQFWSRMLACFTTSLLV